MRGSSRQYRTAIEYLKALGSDKMIEGGIDSDANQPLQRRPVLAGFGVLRKCRGPANGNATLELSTCLGEGRSSPLINARVQTAASTRLFRSGILAVRWSSRRLVQEGNKPCKSGASG